MENAEKLNIKCAAVLGAGVMGAQIAAHLTNAGVHTILFDLPSEKGDQNAIIEESIKTLKKLKPSPLAKEGIENYIVPANYHSDLEKLRNADLVIEAISEKFDWKQSLYQKIIPYLHENVIFASNTSGLSIQKLANVLPEKLSSRFCGVHFFNPPRYMKLVELIAHQGTNQDMLKKLETFLVTRLGKGIVYAKDTPNFIGNRIGVFAFLAATHHSHELGLSPDIVDALTGTMIGRPKSATFRTMDVVGLDTMSHVVNTLKQDLSEDPWYAYFELPTWIGQLIEKGYLGQKKGAGVYKKVGSQIQVYDPHDSVYRPISNHVDNELLNILQQSSGASLPFAAFRESQNKQAQFLWRIFRDLFHYCAYHLSSIAETVREVDLAMRWGFGWQRGPFEMWQSAGWQMIANAITDESAKEMTMSQSALPEWVFKKISEGPYQQGKAFSPQKNEFLSRSNLNVYHRQYFPDQMLGEKVEEGETVFETPAVRLWTRGDNIAILSFKTKKNCIGLGVLEGIQEAIARTEMDFAALVLWQRHGADFSVGADLKQVGESIAANRFDLVEKAVKNFQKTALALRYAKVPTIAAIRGLTLGGACELSMHATEIVAAFETYMGLVEVGVGLLPAGAGSKELAYRASEQAIDGDIYRILQIYFQQIARAKISESAMDAKKLQYLRPSDTVVFNTDELLYMAIKRAKILADLAYHPPLSPKFPVAGKTGIANMMTQLVNLREGEFISNHDFLIGTKVAHVLCGGEVEAGSMVDEDWILHLEYDAIIELLKTNETLERIKFMLEKGKPLRN